MDLRTLRSFVAIVEAGSISAAADRLGIAQPALSLQIRRLEDSLGCRLLQRLPKGVVPTEAGDRLLLLARDILARTAAALDAMRGEAGEPIGQVRLGLPQSVASILTVPLVRRVLVEMPKVRLTVMESMTGHIPVWLHEGRIDLGMLFDADGLRGLALERLIDERLYLVGPPRGVAGRTGWRDPRDGSVDFGELGSIPLVLPSAAHGLRRIIDRCARRAGVRLTVLAEVDALAQLTAIASTGLGASILSFATIRDALAAGRIRAWLIRNPPIVRSIFMCRASDRPQSSAAQAVERLLRASIRDLVSDGAWPGGVLRGPEDGHPAKGAS